MGNNFYNRGASFNPDELADGDAIEAEFDAVARGFDTIKDLVNANKAGYPTQTFHVAPATEATHAVQKAQLDASVAGLNNSIAATNADLDQLQTEVGTKLAAASYSASDVLAKLKTVDGTNSGLDADLLDGQEGSYYRNASNINNGTLAKERLPASIDASTSGNAATASKVSNTAPNGGTADLVSGVMAGSDFFRIRVGGGPDAGWTEIATADNGNEPIYVRQYTGDFVTVARTVTLLDGSGNTSFPGSVSATGFSGPLTGNASTATTLQTARTINNVSFNGGANITVEPYVELDTGTAATRYLTFVDSSTAGYQRMNMDTALTYNPSTNVLGATISGNAATATKLQTARTITLGGDLSGSATFDGSANITINGSVNNIAVLHGTIANGGTIPLPSGYTEAQCKWIVSINDSNANGSGWDVREGLSTNHYETRCYTTGRVVTATMYAYNDTTDAGVTYNATANYIIIGVK